MSQNVFSSIIPAATSGVALCAIVEAFKNAAVSGFSGTSRPSQIKAGGYWIDISNDPSYWEMKIYDGSTDISLLKINLTLGTAVIASTDSLFRIEKTSSDAVGPLLELVKKRIANSGQTLDGDSLGEIQFWGTTSSAVAVEETAIRAVAEGNTTTTSSSGYLVFEVTPDNTSTLVEAMRIIDGKLGVGGVSSPTEILHVKGTIRSSRTSDDTTLAAKVIQKKKRITGTGQVLSGDSIGKLEFNSTDNTGTGMTVAEIEVSARENISSTSQGSKIVFRNKKLGQNTFTDQITIDESVTIPNLTSPNVNATTVTATTLTKTGGNANFGTVVNVQDPSITVNKGGTSTTADAGVAGFEVEVTDGTNFRVGYDSTKTSKVKAGLLGSESEVIVKNLSQTLNNKTLSGTHIESPTRFDVKKDTFANLTTYAATATSGQACYATDVHKLYFIKDNILVEVRSSVPVSQTSSHEQFGRIIFPRQWTTPFRLGPPVPTSATNVPSVKFSPCGRFLAASNASLTVYERRGNAFSGLPALPSVPAAVGYIDWSYDSRFLSIGHNVSPFQTHWQRNAQNTWAVLAAPATAVPAAATACKWSPDSRFVAIGHNTTPFVSIYERLDVTLTKVTNPATLPPSAVLEVTWHPKMTQVVMAHATTPFISIYTIANNVFTKLADPTVLPSAACNSAAFHPNGNVLAVATTDTVNGVQIFSVSGNTFTRLALSTVPTQPAFAANCVVWSKDGRYLLCTYAGQNNFTVYEYDGTTFTLIPFTATNASNTVNRADFHPTNRFVAAAIAGNPGHQYFETSGVEVTNPNNTPNIKFIT